MSDSPSKTSTNVYKQSDINADSTIQPPQRVPMPTPTWSPGAEAQKKDVTACRVAPCEVDGDYAAVPDGSNPSQLEKVHGGGFLDSEHLLTGGASGRKNRYPYGQ